MELRKIIETAKDSACRLTEVSPETRKLPVPSYFGCTVNIDTSKEFQEFQGFGGALTEASAFVLSSLDAKDRQKVVQSYFDSQEGNGYRFARTHLNSCDFSLGNWACIESKDETLESFSMDRVDKYQTPLLKEALEHAGPDMKLMVSPWSPPGWMKDNGEMNNGGKLLKQYYPLWARYIVRFIQELEKRGIPVWSLSIQNEPAATQRWDSCRWTAQEEAEFAVDHLKPELEKAGYGNTGIFVWDHNRDELLNRFTDSMAYPGAEKAISGAAFHWYSGDQFNHVQEVAKRFPHKLLVFTEGCIEGGPRPGAWFTGERYAHNIFNDLNHGCNAWIDWNIALDMQGGPNHVHNYCDAPVLVDTQGKTFHHQSTYYYIGHFSRYIQPGARRLATTITSTMIPAAVSGNHLKVVEGTAFRNPDGTVVFVMYNRTEAELPYTLGWNGQGSGDQGFLPPRSIETLVFAG